MSIPRKIQVNCPNCNKVITTTVWDSVNTELSKGLAQRIICGEFFEVKCSDCGTVFTTGYNMLYHDIEKSAMIWLVGRETPNYFDKCAEVRDTEIPSGYKTRLVKDVDELREKVAALEAERDDRVIELCKVFLKHNVSQQHPDFKPKRLFYTYVEEREIVFLYDADGNQMSCYLDAKLYDSVAEDFSEYLNNLEEHPYEVYDFLWAERVFLRNRSVNNPSTETERSLEPAQSASGDSMQEKNVQVDNTAHHPGLEGNPFYVLEVSCVDDRRKIISAAEEKSFFLDTDICTEAQNILITPGKRLAAEMDWFIETDEELLQEIRCQIVAGEPIDVENLKMLSKLNGMLYNFSILTEVDSATLGLDILDINQCFFELNSAELTEMLNSCRKRAKMTEVTETDIAVELGKKRERIRTVISEKLQTLREMDYMSMVTVFAESYIADAEFEDSGIISDVIDQYELWAKAAMDKREDAVRDCVELIKNLSEYQKREEMVDILIKRIGEWDRYAQPLQVCLSARGMEDRISRNLVTDIRDLAIYLHNEKGETDLALKITKSLKKYFAELSEVLELIEEDEETLQRLKTEKENFAREKESHRRADKVYAVDIRGEQVSIPPYCTCCMSPTEKKERVSATFSDLLTSATRTLGIDMPVCDHCLSHRERPAWHLLLVLGLSVLLGSLSMLFLTLVECPGFIGFMISLVVAIAGYFGFGHAIKLPELSDILLKHSTRGKSVRLAVKRHYPGIQNSVTTMTFTFTNWEYAQLFKAANGDRAGEIREISEPNTAKKIDILRGVDKEDQKHFAFGAFMFFIIVSVFITNISFSGGSSKPSYSSGSSNKTESSYDSGTSYGSNNAGTSSSSATLYSPGMSTGSKTYIDIVSIFPEIGIYTVGSSTYSDFVCRCKTSSGSTVWVYMTVSEYRTNFDADASASVYNEYAEEVTFSVQKRIRGTVKRAESVMDGLSSDINASTLIDYSNAY